VLGLFPARVASREVDIENGALTGIRAEGIPFIEALSLGNKILVSIEVNTIGVEVVVPLYVPLYVVVVAEVVAV